MNTNVALIAKSWAQTRQIPVYFTQQVNSTNSWASEDAFSSDSQSQLLRLYLTEHQTQGRGRKQRHWQDQGSGEQLLSTWSFRRKTPAQPILSCLTGLALYQAAQEIWPKQPWALKPPNDLHLGVNKVAGILIESLSQGDEHRVLVGIGLNFFSHPSLANTTSLAETLPAEELLSPRLEEFLTALHLRLCEAVEQSSNELTEQQGRELLVALNQFALKPATYLKVRPDGSLETQDKLIEWRTL